MNYLFKWHFEPADGKGKFINYSLEIEQFLSDHSDYLAFQSYLHTN